MLGQAELKSWLHKPLAQLDKLLLLLGSFDGPCQVRDIRKRATEAGFRMPSNWNPSAVLGRSGGLAIRTPAGWEISDAGRQHLRNLGVSEISPAAAQVAVDLRNELSNIKDDETRTFVEESIRCYEFGLYRPAIVMSWLATVHTLHMYVLKHDLHGFNTEATRVDGRWKPAKTTDDLGRMKESDFLRTDNRTLDCWQECEGRAGSLSQATQCLWASQLYHDWSKHRRTPS